MHYITNQRRQRLFLVKWSGYGYERSTWQRAVELVQNGAGTMRARQLEVSALVARLRAQPAGGRYGGTLLERRRAVERQYGVQLRAPLPDVLDFNLLPALQREFAEEPGGWKALQASSDLTDETPRLRRALAVMEVHAHRTAQPQEAATDMPPADTHAAWPDESGSQQAWRGQTHLPGTARATGDAAPDPANVCNPRAEADDFLECLRRELDIDGLGDVGGGDVSDVEIQRLRDQQQSQRRGQGQGQRQDEAVRPVWPIEMEPGRLAPSLEPAEGKEERRLRREGPPVERATAWARRLEACLVAPTGGGSVWRWQQQDTSTDRCRAVGMEAEHTGDPIAAMFAPWPEAETPHAPGTPAGVHRLYRGLTSQEAENGGSQASWSDGTDKAHAMAIAQGAKAEAGGVSYTKDPVVAAAFAAGGSTLVACYDQQVLQAEGPLHDFSGMEGAVRLAKALPEGGGGRLAATYAAADAEVRADGPTQMRWLDSFGVDTPRSEGGKKAWKSALEQAAVDKIYDAAARCESRGAWPAPRAWYAAGGAVGPALRMEWAEAALLSSETTAAMAAMAVRLHAQHGFTHACATDGGKGEGPPRSGSGLAEERTAFGLVAYSSATGRRALGGALPPGSTVQDAEMQAMLACVRWAADPRNGDTTVRERRLFILSDSNTQLGQVEKALRGPGPRGLRGAQRRGALEELTKLRLTMAKVVTQFVRSHEGVRPNAHADMVATAFMRADTADTCTRADRRGFSSSGCSTPAGTRA